MRIKKNGKVIRLSESDLKRIVKRVLTEDAPNKGQEHKKEIEAFMKCPTDAKARQKAKERLEDDAYSKKGKLDTNIGKGTKGAVKIKYNGREMDVESFLSEVESDYAEDGKCKDVIKFDYKNRMLGKTTIDIETTDKGKCKCKKESLKGGGDEKKPNRPEKQKKTDCRKPDYFINTRKYYDQHKRSRGINKGDFWDTVIPKMGVSQSAMCACFKQHKGLSPSDERLMMFLCEKTGRDLPSPIGRRN